MDRDKTKIYEGMKVTILGMAKSGQAAAKMLSGLGAKVFCSDSGCPKDIETLGFPYETGAHSDKVYDAQMMVVSPGIPHDNPVVMRAKMKGIKVRGELDLAAELLSCPYAAITGTSGKSTTTGLIAHMLNKAGKKSKAVGNIGDPLSNYVVESRPEDVMSIEVSSFQCELMESFYPGVAVFTNLAEDHLNRHGTMGEYARLKEKMFVHMKSDDLVVLNKDDEWSGALSAKTPSKSLYFSMNNAKADAYFDGKSIFVSGKKIASMKDYKLFGWFNAMNLMAAGLAVSRFGLDPATAIQSSTDFVPLHNRLEFVGQWGGVKFINDSKATKPSATTLALNALEGPFILILGGSEKGSDFSVLPADMGNVRLAVIHGQTAQRIEEALINGNFKKFVSVKDQAEAIEVAIKEAKPGDTVLLSPACASFDQFGGYEERGEVFTRQVREQAPKALGS
ncbi:MAG: UDP-N-acetylmuramoyl-L-alanine--D-glutamate ligase [Caldisericia bacterium]|nr:UDP-N-acetylmuramoyl-L-alanine--D-glutamate ligase [Caldisericia bacterium]